MFMAKRPISVTLTTDNLTWLQARAISGKRRSISEALDEIVTAARTSADGRTIRSVVGTIDISASDPALEHADEFIRGLFTTSLSRPLVLHEEQPRYRSSARAPRPTAKPSARRRG
jgi:hypothetical protein